MPLSRAGRQVRAVVQLLQSLTEAQLVDVLSGVGATLDGPAKRKGATCGICTLPYPICRDRWGDDHEFEGPKRESGGDQGESCPVHSQAAWAKAIRTNRELLGDEPQPCTCRSDQ